MPDFITTLKNISCETRSILQFLADATLHPNSDILYCDIILLYIDSLTILFSFILLVKLMRLSLVFIKGLTWLDLQERERKNLDWP